MASRRSNLIFTAVVAIFLAVFAIGASASEIFGRVKVGESTGFLNAIIVTPVPVFLSSTVNGHDREEINITPSPTPSPTISPSPAPTPGAPATTSPSPKPKPGASPTPSQSLLPQIIRGISSANAYSANPFAATNLPPSLTTASSYRQPQLALILGIDPSRWLLYILVSMFVAFMVFIFSKKWFQK